MSDMELWEQLRAIAELYSNVRQSHPLSPLRAVLHDALLTAFTTCGIAYNDRHHAAELAARITRGEGGAQWITYGRMRLF